MGSEIAAANESTPQPDEPAHPRTGVVLVVEDYEDVRVGISELLQLNGYQVADAPDAEQAMECLQSKPASYALVLLDLLLPGISGATFRNWQLSKPGLASIPTVLVTAFEPKAETVASLRPASWLEKPFRADDILRIVRRYVTPDTVATAEA